MKLIRYLLITLLLTTCTLAGRAVTPADSCRCEGVSKTHWIRQLIDNNFRLNDSTICYPAFPRFALKVYNWGDRTFNSYDTTYVVGTGKNWKLMAKSYNWMEATTLLFPEDVSLDMHSTLFSDAGLRLSFMAVSVGYMWNMNKLFSHPTARHSFDFAFTCSRFTLAYETLSSEGGMIMTHLGDYNEGRSFRYHFDDVRFRNQSAQALYFFSHNRYSHAAAYTYSKYQLRSAGTAMVGLSFVEQEMEIDFASLPADMQAYVPLDDLRYNSHFRSYNISGGYSYNWVLSPRKWMLNGYATGAIGYRQVFGTREHRDFRSLVANSFQLSAVAVYNHRALFAAFTAKMYGLVNYNSNYTHFNAYPTFTLVVGMRF